MTTSGPNPWFCAQNHGFGPDVVTFSVNCVNPSKTDKKDLIWPKPRFWAREPGFGPDVVILGVLGGNPRKYAACVARPWAQPLKNNTYIGPESLYIYIYIYYLHWAIGIPRLGFWGLGSCTARTPNTRI